MSIKVNGEFQAVDKATLTVAELLTLRNVEHPETVSVQLNGKFVDSRLYAATTLKDNDEVDFLYFLGGGASR